MNKILNMLGRTIALALVAGSASAATATTAPSASSSAAAPALHLITGFRSAHFGMTEPEVRAAIEHDFKPAVGAVTELDNPIEKTRVIALRLASLDPAPGTVNLTYIFGANTQRLIHVNVVWSTGNAPSGDERLQMGTASVQLAGYFRALQWQRGATTASVAPDGSSAVVFAGVDPKDEAVEVRVSGVPIERRGKPSAAPVGPAVLHVAYFATTGRPDTSDAVKVGSF